MQKVKLENYVEQIRGVSYKSTDLFEKLEVGSVILLRANNIFDSKVNFEDVVYVDKNKVKNNQFLRAGDILICTSSGSKDLVGKAAYIENDLNVTFGAFCKVIRPKGIESAFLGHFFQSQIYRHSISESCIGVNINNIRGEHIDNLEIPLPSFSEQKAIAEKLDKVSILIEKRKQQLSLLDTLVKSKFVEMFGEGNQSNFELVPLYKVSKKIFAGGDKPKKTVAVKDNIFQYPVYANGYENEGLQGYSCEYKVDEYAITISARGTIGYCFIRAPYFTPAVRLITIVPNKECNIIYLKCALQNLDLKASGTSQAQLTVPLFRQERIAVPPICLQNKFANFVKQTEKSKEKIKQSLAALELLKKSLMQKYFG